MIEIMTVIGVIGFVLLGLCLFAWIGQTDAGQCVVACACALFMLACMGVALWKLAGHFL